MFLPEKIIDRGEIKEKEICSTVIEFPKEEFYNITNVEPQCDCMDYELHSDEYTLQTPYAHYRFWFTPNNVPNNKESYNTEKLIVLRYKNDDIRFLKIKAVVTK